jgi:cell division protein FtsB
MESMVNNKESKLMEAKETSKDILPLSVRCIILENGNAHSLGINPHLLIGKYHKALESAESENESLKKELKDLKEKVKQLEHDNFIATVTQNLCTGFDNRCKHYQSDKNCCYDCGLFKNNKE